MKLLNKYGFFALLLVFAFTACEKAPEIVNYKNGTAVTLSASTTAVTMTAADSNTVKLTLNWTSPAYATDSNTYKYILELDSSTRNFTKPNTVIQTGSKTKSFTGKQINNMLLNYGFAIGVPVDLDFRITSSYANNNEQYKSNIVKIRITPYNDPSVLTSTNTSVVCSIASSTASSNTFNWTRSFTGYTGNINYVLQYDSATKNFASPKEITVGANVLTKAMTQGEMNTTAIACGVAGGATGSVTYRVKATTANGQVSYSNAVTVSIKSYVVALYIVGGSSPADWNPAAAIAMIPDPQFPGVFYAYSKLTTSGWGIKFLAENTDWNTPTQVIYGDANGSGNTGTLTTSGGGNNVVVPADGIYRIVVDLANMKYYLQTGGIGAVGLVGGFQGWSPGSAIKMMSPKPNMLIYLTNMTQNDEFKFHDGNDWTNSALNGSKWYDDNGNNTLIKNGPSSGSNLKWTGPTGRVRAIFNYTDVKNPSFSLTEGTGMWVIGSATPGAWNNSGTENDLQRPPLTYQGNGVWKGTVTLSAGDIKFIVKKGDWSFSYGGSNGKISYQNGANITVTAGTYQITVDEYAGTYTIL